MSFLAVWSWGTQLMLASDEDGAVAGKLPPSAQSVSGTHLKNTWISQSGKYELQDCPFCRIIRPLLGTEEICVHCQEHPHHSPSLSAGPVPQSWPWQQLNEKQMQSRTLCDVKLNFLLQCDLFVQCKPTIRLMCCFLHKYVLSIAILIPFRVSVYLICSCICRDLGARFHRICDTCFLESLQLSFL